MSRKPKTEATPADDVPSRLYQTLLARQELAHPSEPVAVVWRRQWFVRLHPELDAGPAFTACGFLEAVRRITGYLCDPGNRTRDPDEGVEVRIARLYDDLSPGGRTAVSSAASVAGVHRDLWWLNAQEAAGPLTDPVPALCRRRASLLLCPAHRTGVDRVVTQVGRRFVDCRTGELVDARVPTTARVLDALTGELLGGEPRAPRRLKPDNTVYAFHQAHAVLAHVHAVLGWPGEGMVIAFAGDTMTSLYPDRHGWDWAGWSCDEHPASAQGVGDAYEMHRAPDDVRTVVVRLQGGAVDNGVELVGVADSQAAVEVLADRAGLLARPDPDAWIREALDAAAGATGRKRPVVAAVIVGGEGRLRYWRQGEREPEPVGREEALLKLLDLLREESGTALLLGDDGTTQSVYASSTDPSVLMAAYADRVFNRR